MLSKEALSDIFGIVHDDVLGADPDCIGAILITLHRTHDDHLALRSAASVPPDIALFALTKMVEDLVLSGPRGYVFVNSKTRKKAV